MQDLHGPGPVFRMHTRHHRTAVQCRAFRQSHQEKNGHQQQCRPGQGGSAVSQRIPRAKDQDRGACADFSRQPACQESRQHIADAHHGKQRSRPGKGQPVLLPQQADHNAAGHGADSAEEKHAVSRSADSRILSRLSPVHKHFLGSCNLLWLFRNLPE